jgi:hypothetical protein
LLRASGGAKSALFGRLPADPMVGDKLAGGADLAGGNAVEHRATVVPYPWAQRPKQAASPTDTVWSRVRCFDEEKDVVTGPAPVEKPTSVLHLK